MGSLSFFRPSESSTLRVTTHRYRTFYRPTYDKVSKKCLVGVVMKEHQLMSNFDLFCCLSTFHTRLASQCCFFLICFLCGFVVVNFDLWTDLCKLHYLAVDRNCEVAFFIICMMGCGTLLSVCLVNHSQWYLFVWSTSSLWFLFVLSTTFQFVCHFSVCLVVTSLCYVFVWLTTSWL